MRERPALLRSRGEDLQLKGFVFTLDAFMALAIAIAALSAVVSVSQSAGEEHRIPGLASLARDYLVVKYSLNRTITPAGFSALTGKTLFETDPPVNSTLGRADILVFPSLLDCAVESSCNITNSSTQASFFDKYDGDRARRFHAWVKP